jgi:hypothetical protein
MGDSQMLGDPKTNGGLTMTSRLQTCFMLSVVLVFCLLFSSPQTACAQTPPNVGDVLISEFRTRGPNGQNDEFIEIYNNTDADIIVADSHPITCAGQLILTPPLLKCGWAIVDAQGGGSGIPRAIIPINEIIPARGHYLLANSGTMSDPGYSLSSYAPADTPYAPPGYTDSDFTGLALYRTADRAEFINETPLDAVGFDGIGSPYREGTGLQPANGISNDNIEHSFVRKMNLTTDRPIDTNSNIDDFVFVATTAGAAGDATTAVLGAPGPESKTSPLASTNKFTTALYDPSRTASQSPNRCYDSTDTSPGAGTLGSLFIRRNLTNNSAPVTQLRFRVVDITTVGSPGSMNQGQAIIKPVTSTGGTTPCPDTLFNGTPVAVQNTTLDSPSPATGGGLNSTLSTTPIPAGQNRNVLYRLAADRTGSFRFLLVYEAK